MNFDSILSIILIIAFFVLPSVLKHRAGQKKAGTSRTNKPEPGFFAWIGTRISNFAGQLEMQDKKHRIAPGPTPSLWEALAEDETINTVPEYGQGTEPDTPPQSTATHAPENDDTVQAFAGPDTDGPWPDIPDQDTAPVTKIVPDAARPDSPALNFRKNQLRNAVIWSEILSKPLALRDETGIR
jgi:hypothetical protein